MLSLVLSAGLIVTAIGVAGCVALRWSGWRGDPSRDRSSDLRGPNQQLDALTAIIEQADRAASRLEALLARAAEIPVDIERPLARIERLAEPELLDNPNALTEAA